MRKYTPYLLFQMARFGALTVPQMLRICEGKCKKSALYKALDELYKGGFSLPILNPASRTRAYYATKEGHQYVFGKESARTVGIRAAEIDHTVLCADVLLELCRYGNVTGIATQFELDPAEAKSFCHDRVPDGIFRLHQEGHDFEIALEVESTSRGISRIKSVLDRYWETFKLCMPCSALLIVAMDKTILNAYTNVLKEMPPEFQARVRVVLGKDLNALQAEAYGPKGASIHQCVEKTRTSSITGITYIPAKAEVFLSESLVPTPDISGSGQK